MRELYVTPIRRLFAFALLVLLVSQGAVSYLAWLAVEEKIRPELDRKARMVSVSLGEKVTRALDYGIPFDRLNGVEEFFDGVLRDNPDLGFIALSDAQGQILFASGAQATALQRAMQRTQAAGAPAAGVPAAATNIPAMLENVADGARGEKRSFHVSSASFGGEGARLGGIHVGVDVDVVSGLIRGLRYDIAIVLLTSMLIAFEVLLFVVSLNYLEPMRQLAEMMSRMAAGDFRSRTTISAGQAIGALAASLNRLCIRINRQFRDLQAAGAEAAALRGMRERYRFADGGEPASLRQPRIVTIRILTFLFMFAEMLSRSFLPVHSGSLPVPAALGLSPAFAASLPLTANLLCVALCLPFAGRWSDRLGRRSSYVLGAGVLTLGLLAAAAGEGFAALLLARMIAGVGYAILYMACQGYVIDHTDSANRSQGMAAFVSAIMVAEICAPAVGGILADRVGAHPVFMIGAVIAVAATLLALRTLDDATARRGSGGPKPAGGSAFAMLLRNPRFIAIAVLAGVPAKLLLSGFLIYLVPVILTGMRATPAEIGRYAMLYGVLSLCLGPWLARLTDRFGAHVWAVAGGSVISGAGLLSILVQATPGAVIAGIAALGLGQAFSITAQLGLVSRVTQRETDASGASSVMGVFRLMERLGGAAGPMVAGGLAALAGPPQAMAMLGGFSILAALLFLMVFQAGTRRAQGEAAALPGETA
jgi:MFS family permease/HAMP domain-containing protein